MLALAEVLSRYGAAEARWTGADGSVNSDQGSGGGLAQAVERHGVLPLAASLADGETLALEDGDVSMEIVRSGSVASLRVAWAQGPSYEETLAIRPGEAMAFARDEAPGLSVDGSGVAVFCGDPAARVTDLAAALADTSLTLYVTDDGVYTRGRQGDGAPLRGVIAPVSRGQLGARSFLETHGVDAAYIAGAMAGGIGSVEIIVAMARAGMLGFFGAGGLPLDAVEEALKDVRSELGDEPGVGFNLLHNPVEPGVEDKTVDLYLQHGIRRVSASAYMQLTPAIVRYRLSGIRREGDAIVLPNKVFAKISRPETAELFLRPAPSTIVQELLAAGQLTQEQAELAALVPMAEDVTVEADSGGHTDRRPLVGMLPIIRRLRDRVSAEEGYTERGIVVRVGAAGGLGDPASVHAAFGMGADYVLTGSINQSTLEAGTSRMAKEMVAAASVTDCTTGPAPDMFEIGAHVQVLSRGSMYAQRAGKLYDLYKRYASIEEIPAKDRDKIERQIFGRNLDDVWAETEEYWKERDPREVEKAHKDARHKMALTFRWYLGFTSRWARTGEEARRRDFQIWCGPAMGAFNNWVRGTWLEPVEARKVVDVAHALLDGSCVLHRVHQARMLGVVLPPGIDQPVPRRRD